MGPHSWISGSSCRTVQGPGEIKRREVELDSRRESTAEIKSREVELISREHRRY